jgi:hypothetical protein
MIVRNFSARKARGRFDLSREDVKARHVVEVWIWQSLVEPRFSVTVMGMRLASAVHNGLFVLAERA